MMKEGMSGTTASLLLREGRAALARAEWERARDLLQESIRLEETPEALESLGNAGTWLNDVDLAIWPRERAFLLYKERGDVNGAARVASYVAIDYAEFRGEETAAYGWLGRAERILEGHPISPEHGLVLILNGHIALNINKETAKARTFGEEATRVGMEVGDSNVEMMGLALEGLARVSEGDVAAGMRLLDQATTAAVAGESTDLNYIGTTCCYLITACERVRDYDRAAQWCDRVKAFCLRWRYDSMFSICRTQYASILTWQGKWEEAEAELHSAIGELSIRRPPLVNACIVRLGELRRRQGAYDEADRLFNEVRTHPLALLGRASLELDRGNGARALEMAERFLRRFPPDDRIERIAGLEVLVRAAVDMERLETAHTALSELRSIAEIVTTGPLRGAASFAEGVVAVAEGRLDTARVCFEDAIDYLQEIKTPFECGRARMELAQLLARLNRPDDAVREAELAREIFRNLGARGEEERAERFLKRSAPERSIADSDNPDGLTRRELEILDLIGEGKSNDEIARELFLSVRTVERHVSNVYLKIGASGGAARGAAAAYAHRKRTRHLR